MRSSLIGVTPTDRENSFTHWSIVNWRHFRAGGNLKAFAIMAIAMGLGGLITSSFSGLFPSIEQIPTSREEYSERLSTSLLEYRH